MTAIGLMWISRGVPSAGLTSHQISCAHQLRTKIHTERRPIVLCEPSSDKKIHAERSSNGSRKVARGTRKLITVFRWEGPGFHDGLHPHLFAPGAFPLACRLHVHLRLQVSERDEVYIASS